MNDNKFLIAFLSVICLVNSITNFVGSKTINKLKEQNITLKAKYDVVCGNLNDCCRNMIDAYDLPDSIYNSYLDIIEEQGYSKQEVKHLYFSY